MRLLCDVLAGLMYTFYTQASRNVQKQSLSLSTGAESERVWTTAADRASPAMKYILVSGGVISGVGKGVITSSIGTLLKSVGLKVTAIKIDPYLNIDAGTFSPYEHG